MITMIVMEYTPQEFQLISDYCHQKVVTLQFVNIKPLLQCIKDIRNTVTAGDEFDVRYRYNKHFFSTLFPDYSQEDIELFALFGCSLRVNYFNSDAIDIMERVINHKYPNTKFYNYLQQDVIFMLMQIYTWFGRKDDAAKLLERLNTEKVEEIDFNNI